MNEQIGLRWTGHPVIDMGVAAVTVAVDAETPEQVTRNEWNGLMGQLEKDYIDGVYKKAVAILLTLNSFENPSFKKNPEGRIALIHEAFQVCRGEVDSGEEHCTFFPERSALLRGARDRYPLLLGREQINFYPHGGAELPMSDLALGCILALPLASPIVSGRFMIIAMDDHDFLLELCDRWYRALKADYGIVRLGKGELRERKAPRTRLFEELNSLMTPHGQEHRFGDDFTGFIHTTLYHLTNSGNGPMVDIYLAYPTVNHFLYRANSARFKPAWNALLQGFWRTDKGKLEGDEPTEEKRPLCKNDLYEVLHRLPDDAATFIRRFFFRYAANRVGWKTDLTVSDVDLWPLLELFLEEVIHMNKERVDTIRTIADELAGEIHENNDKGLYRRLMGITGGRDAYSGFRALLLRAMRERLARKQELILGLDQYLLVFEEGEEFPHADWRLARDLIRIRVLETLHSLGYFNQEPELLKEESEETLEAEAA